MMSASALPVTIAMRNTATTAGSCWVVRARDAALVMGIKMRVPA